MGALHVHREICYCFVELFNLYKIKKSKVIDTSIANIYRTFIEQSFISKQGQ
jgi:hypothetical protein